MRNSVLFLAVVVLGLAAFVSAEDGPIYIDDQMTTTVQRRSVSGEDDGDDGDGSGVLADESGSGGSGETTTDTTTEQTTTEKPTTPDKPTSDDIDVQVVTKKTTGRPTEEQSTPKSTATSKSTADSPVASEEATTQKEDDSTKEPTVDPNDDVNAMARSDPDEKVLRVLTTEVIAAVVVGAVCAVILIAFLVYRLRKRDEGSYPLTDSSYKDTYKLRGDNGKEAFV